MEQVKIPSPLEPAVIVKKLGLQNIPAVAALLRSYTADPTPEKYSRLFKFINPYLVRDALKPDPFRPYPTNEIDGPIRLGICNETSAIFGLYPDELNQGSVIAGRPGAGKTTFCYRLITAVNKLGIHCLIFDLKQDYRHLIRILPDTMVFRCCKEDAPYLLRWNPYDFPGPPEDWIPIVSNITAEAYGFYQGTDNYIAKLTYDLYEETKPFPPTLIQLKKKIEEDRQPLIKRDARFKETSLNRINPLVIRAYNTLNCSHGYNIEKLLKKYNVVLELDGLGTGARSYFTPLVLAHVFQTGILNRNEPFPILVIIDEANEIFNREIERQRGDLTISQLAREAREFRIGIISSCQLPESLCNSVKNCYTRIMMSLSEGENIRSFSQSLGLTPEQKETVWQLQPGQAIGRFARYPNPFLVVFPDFPIEKNVSANELTRHMQNFASELGIPQERKEQHANFIPIPLPGKKEEVKKDTTGARSKEKDILVDIYFRPYDFKTQHYKNVGLSAGNGTAIFKSLVSKGLCIEEEINLGGRGGLTKFPVLTEKGYAAIGMQPKPHIGRGTGFQHEYWQVKISEHLKGKGYKIEIEKNLNGKFLDLGIETDKGIIAISIAMCPDHEIINVDKDLAAGCIGVIIACKDKTVMEKLNNLKSEKIHICLVHELLKAGNIEELIRGDHGLF
ncbi:MAG: hypothetical protein V2A65_02920 [Candidatus Omnitrophota bacterium]